MKVIVDTDVWSEALRKKQGRKSNYVDELTDLIQEGRLEIYAFLSGLDSALFYCLFKTLFAKAADLPEQNHHANTTDQ